MRFFLAILAFAALSSPAFAQSSMGSMGSMNSTHGMTMMPHCKTGDPVVWINTKSMVYYMKGSTYYGKTSKGKYACASAANTMGAHAPGRSQHMTSQPMSPHMMASPGMNPPNPQPSMGISSPMPHMSSSPSP